MSPDLTTAAGVIAALVAILTILWRDHLRADAADRKRADDNFLLARDAVDGVKRLADLQASRERRERKPNP